MSKLAVTVPSLAGLIADTVIPVAGFTVIAEVVSRYVPLRVMVSVAVPVGTVVAGEIAVNVGAGGLVMVNGTVLL